MRWDLTPSKLLLDCPHRHRVGGGTFFLGIGFALVKQLVGVDIGFTPLAVRWPPLALVAGLVGGGSFLWHRVCISKTTGWGGHRVHPVGCTMAPIGFCQRCVSGGVFCSTILHSMVRCPVGRACLRKGMPYPDRTSPSLAIHTLVSGGFLLLHIDTFPRPDPRWNPI